MNALKKLAYQMALESIQEYDRPLKKQAIWPALASILPWLGQTLATAGVFTGTGYLVHEAPYLWSKLTGRGAKDMTAEEQEIFSKLRDEGKSPLYAYQEAVRTTAAKYGLADFLQEGTPLTNLTAQERQSLYATQQRKIRALEQLTGENDSKSTTGLTKEDLEFGPWGPTWSQWKKLKTFMNQQASSPEEGLV